MASRTPAQEAVLRGFAFAAAVRMALPRAEAWRFSWEPGSLTPEALQQAVSALLVNGTLREGEDGTVWLADQEAPERGRATGRQVAVRKWRLAWAFAQYAAWVPGVRGVAVCNTLAWNAVEEKSDIDFFILTHPGATWMVRLLTTLPLRLMRLRPGEGTRDPICLSFFASTHAMNLEGLARAQGEVYLPYWVCSLVFLVDDGVAASFRAANTWVSALVPQMEPMPPALPRRACRPGWAARWLWHFGTLLTLWGWVEWFMREAQEKRLPPEIQQVAAQGSDHQVVLSPHIIKLHVRDERAAIWERFQMERKRVGV